MWLTGHLAFDTRLTKREFGYFVKTDFYALSHSGKVLNGCLVQMTKTSMPG